MKNYTSRKDYKIHELRALAAVISHVIFDIIALALIFGGQNQTAGLCLIGSLICLVSAIYFIENIEQDEV